MGVAAGDRKDDPRSGDAAPKAIRDGEVCEGVNEVLGLPFISTTRDEAARARVGFIVASSS